jgi:hypothetical protein
MATIFGPKGKWRGGETGSRGRGRSAAFHGSGGDTGSGATPRGGGGVTKIGSGGCCQGVEEKGGVPDSAERPKLLGRLWEKNRKRKTGQGWDLAELSLDHGGKIRIALQFF